LVTAFDHFPDNVVLYWPGLVFAAAAWGLLFRSWWGRHAGIAGCVLVIASPLAAFKYEVSGSPMAWGFSAVAILASFAYFVVATPFVYALWRLTRPDAPEWFRSRPERRRWWTVPFKAIGAALVLLVGVALTWAPARDGVVQSVEDFAEQRMRTQMRGLLDEYVAAVQRGDGQAQENAVRTMNEAGGGIIPPRTFVPAILTETLAKFEQTEDTRVRLALVDLLLHRVNTYNSNQATALIYRLLNDPNPEVRRVVAKQLSKATPQPAPYSNYLSPLANRVQDEDELPEVRIHAAMALSNTAARWRDEQYRRQLAPALQVAFADEDPQLRATALRGLIYADPASVIRIAQESSRAAEDYVPLLIALLQDGDNHQQHLAAETLGKLAPQAEAAIPALRAMSQGGNRHMESAAQEALRKMENSR
jgi:HEAT repeat protein